MRRKKPAEVSFCELPSKKKPGPNRSAFYRHKGKLCWEGVKDEPYKAGAGGWANITRRVLVGAKGETTRFHVRYFEIGPGGCSSLEFHRHEHVVICVRGRGKVRIGRSRRTMRFMDTAYIAPEEVHQLTNPFDEPFGFLCMVNARRDRPKTLPLSSRSRG